MDRPARILRFPHVLSRTGLSRSSVYARIKAGEFPIPIQLGRRAVGFLEPEVEQWINGLRRASPEASAQRADDAEVLVLAETYFGLK